MVGDGITDTPALALATEISYASFGILLNAIIAGGAMAISVLSVVFNSLWLKYVKLG
jgi:cation transport ATPase